MWPLSFKAGIKKMRSYQKKKWTIEEVEEDDLELPLLLPTRPREIQNTAATVRALRDRDPTQFSDPSIQVFHDTIKSVDVQLQKAHLTTIQHAALQEKIRADGKRKTTSRRSIHKGGPSATINELRTKKQIRDEKEKSEALRKAKKRLVQATNRAKNDLKTQGIQARKTRRLDSSD